MQAEETGGFEDMADLDSQQKKWIDDMIKKMGLNEYADPKGTMYAGGTPLFNEATGAKTDRYTYIIRKRPDWLPQSKK